MYFVLSECLSIHQSSDASWHSFSPECARASASCCDVFQRHSIHGRDGGPPLAQTRGVSALLSPSNSISGGGGLVRSVMPPDHVLNHPPTSLEDADE